ncbi:MAG TPA: BatD family protein, partial [Candidatus Eisenbacteria bacterium]
MSGVSARWRLVLALAALALAAPAAAAVDVQAQLDRTRLNAGETTTLQVVVSGGGSPREPEFQVPDGIEVLGSSRAQNYSWVNGKGTVETLFRYELGTSRAGTFTIGPVRVHAGDEVFSTAPLVLEVIAGLGGGGGVGGVAGGRGGPARLVVDVTPRDPWLGQPTVMRVSLIQRQPLAEDPQYGPPSTTGFWAEPPSRPTSFYSQEGDHRVLVTQTRSRLYPLAPGVATIGAAVAGLTLAGGAASDPFRWPGGNRRHVEVRSDPVQVRVRALPRGAPPGFDGAVGDLDLAWTADRARTSQDVAIGVRLDVRGVGNLPMIHTPTLACADCEIFTGPVEDSLAGSESDGPSRRSFRWTVLPRRTGSLEIPPPAFAWFDPAGAVYRRAAVAPLTVIVDPPISAASSAREAFPPAFVAHPVDPFGRAASPPGWALGGLLLGSSLALWRTGRRRPAETAERARQREWVRALRSSGPEFWRAAEDVCAWLEAHGRPQPELRADLAAARYAAGFADPERFRDRIAAALEAG